MWSLTYLVANICGSVVISVLGYAGGDVVPTWVLALSALTLWGPYIGVLMWVSKRQGSGNFAQDFAIRFQAKDLWGIPLGMASQLLLVILVTLPFQWMFPSLFNKEAVEKCCSSLLSSFVRLWWKRSCIEDSSNTIWRLHTVLEFLCYWLRFGLLQCICNLQSFQGCLHLRSSLDCVFHEPSG